MKDGLTNIRINEKAVLKTKRRNATYPLNFKLNVLRFKLDTGASYIDTANAFGISEPSIIDNWHRQFEWFGTQGLNKPQERLPKIPKSNPNQDKEIEELIQAIFEEHKE